MPSLCDRLNDVSARVRARGHSAVSAEEMGNLLMEIHATYGYEIAMYEQHQVFNPSTHCGYVLCQVSKNELFAKWAKVVGGIAPGGSRGNYLAFEQKPDAKEALEHMDPTIAMNYRIFPVVISAGRTPKD